MNRTSEQDTSNRANLMFQAYAHPTLGRHRFRHPTQCPVCTCELVVEIEELKFSCLGCYSIFVLKPIEQEPRAA